MCCICHAKCFVFITRCQAIACLEFGRLCVALSGVCSASDAFASGFGCRTTREVPGIACRPACVRMRRVCVAVSMAQLRRNACKLHKTLVHAAGNGESLNGVDGAAVLRGSTAPQAECYLVRIISHRVKCDNAPMEETCCLCGVSNLPGCGQCIDGTPHSFDYPKADDHTWPLLPQIHLG